MFHKISLLLPMQQCAGRKRRPAAAVRVFLRGVAFAFLLAEPFSKRGRHGYDISVARVMNT